MDTTSRIIETLVRHGRTNRAKSSVLPGGVAANIARAVRYHRADLKIIFIGAAAIGSSDAAPTLRNADIDVAFVQLDGSPPSYNAILDQDGELIIGVADMALYDAVTSTDIIPLLPQHPRAVIIDANFPEETLVAISAGLPVDCRFYAAGTSAQKVHRLAPIMDRLDALVLNRAEACELAGKTGTVVELATILSASLRPHAPVLVSNGAGPASLAVGGEVISSAPPKITLVNANGAGDAMAAAFFLACLDRPEVSDYTPAGSRELEDLLELALAAGAAHAATGRKT